MNAKLPTTAGNSTCESRVFSPTGYGLTYMQLQCESTSDVIALLPPIMDIFAEAGSIVIDFSMHYGRRRKVKVRVDHLCSLGAINASTRFLL